MWYVFIFDTCGRHSFHYNHYKEHYDGDLHMLCAYLSSVVYATSARTVSFSFRESTNDINGKCVTSLYSIHKCCYFEETISPTKAEQLVWSLRCYYLVVLLPMLWPTPRVIAILAKVSFYIRDIQGSLAERTQGETIKLRRTQYL